MWIVTLPYLLWSTNDQIKDCQVLRDDGKRLSVSDISWRVSYISPLLLGISISGMHWHPFCKFILATKPLLWFWGERGVERKGLGLWSSFQEQLLLVMLLLALLAFCHFWGRVVTYMSCPVLLINSNTVDISGWYFKDNGDSLAHQTY